MAIVPGFLISKKLNNGADILAFKQWRHGGHMIVLAHWVNSTMTPFVTWAVDNNGDAYWGHYFETEDEALADWEKR